MGATNRPEVLDPALLLPAASTGRYWSTSRTSAARRHPPHPREGSEGYRGRDSGDRGAHSRFAGADRQSGERAACSRPSRKPAVEMKDFDEAIDRIVAGLEKKG